MPFQLGDIKIKGTIDDISFYPSVFGWLVRRKGGPSSKQYKTSPAFERSRENNSEFTNCSKSASFIRKLVLKHTGQKDKGLYHRLMAIMQPLANEDQSSVRGQRDPMKGIHSKKAQALLKEFKITEGLNLYELLFKTGFIKTEEDQKPQDLKRIKKSNGLKRPRYYCFHSRNNKSKAFFVQKKGIANKIAVISGAQTKPPPPS